jgi:hypothetical protein
MQSLTRKVRELLQQSDNSFEFLKRGQCFYDIASFQNTVTGGLQNHASRVAQKLFILHKQDSSAPARGSCVLYNRGLVWECFRGRLRMVHCSVLQPQELVCTRISIGKAQSAEVARLYVATS